jgi:hypothetical protein
LKNDTDFLEHFGIPGMHWGHRKSKTVKKSSLRNKKRHEEEYSEDHRKKVSLKKKRISDMSNAELRELTTRLQLEKQYRDLNQTEKSAGRKFAEDILKEVGKELVKNALKAAVNDVTKSAKDGSAHTVTNALSNKIMGIK